ncbi:bis(5'-nucleosyl)-tetraphosphatase (symmetrical) YqeK [Streptococcus sp. zg-JUN1979]|uniref:bis(5'-nucleosyl)-tetraphosphatase (symmetrical) YqeK n=1 Tax=Streptococcus sp. zg-JUN1979 TaxID=3391450 RepID=UPI0039A49B98
MTYEAYVGLSRQDLLAKIAGVMSDKRFKHVLGVEKAAIALAKRYGYDEVKAGLAGLLHDYAKELSDEAFLSLIDRYELDDGLKSWGNNIWHGLVGRYYIEEELGLTDTEILDAIACHTVGSSQMSVLDKIVYVADYIEEGRDFPGVDEARHLAECSLNQAVAYETARTVAYLASQAQPIYPKTLETYNHYIAYLREDGQKKKDK